MKGEEKRKEEEGREREDRGMGRGKIQAETWMLRTLQAKGQLSHPKLEEQEGPPSASRGGRGLAAALIWDF